jgi:hypothetical protein
MKEVIAGLRPVFNQLLADNRRVRVFFRDDDVDEDEATLRRLLRIFLRHEAPINLEIIPGRLTNSAISLLRQYRDFRPHLIGLNQHGWQHVNHEPAGRKCEFGPSRNFDKQREDLSQGRAVLDSAFGTAFFPAFTPPWNRCTNETYQALDELGFKVLSKDQDKPPVAGYRFQEIPVTLDLYRWRHGPVMKAPAEISSELSRQLRDADRVGILLHHKVMDETAFEFLDLLTSELGAQPPVSLELFQSLLRG